MYNEKYRPQFHFTAKTHWLNDPNGCVYYDGTYHLFFQHNPKGLKWGNMTWGHAVSPDLVHWQQVEHAIHPYDGGTIFSGTAAVDADNDSKLGTGITPPLVAAFTHAKKPFGQAIAFSNDHGGTWELYANGKHVVPNQGLNDSERDPKIFRHEPSGKWVMVLYTRKGQARFFTSDDLLQWEHVSDFEGEGFFECPDLIQLPLDGNPQETKWVLHDAPFNYWIGSFDGKTFTADTGPFKGDQGNNFYAAQTWNNTDDRVVQIGWMRGGNYPDMPFNQQMSFPCELSLRTTPRGVRLCRMPVQEISSLYLTRDSVKQHTLEPGTPLEIGGPGELFDLEMEVVVSPESSFSIRVCGQEITWAGGRVTCLGKERGLPASGDVVNLRLLADRTSIELFGNRGEVSMSSCFLAPDQVERVRMSVAQGNVAIRSLTLRKLASVWT